MKRKKITIQKVERKGRSIKISSVHWKEITTLIGVIMDMILDAPLVWLPARFAANFRILYWPFQFCGFSLWMKFWFIPKNFKRKNHYTEKGYHNFKLQHCFNSEGCSISISCPETPPPFTFIATKPLYLMKQRPYRKKMLLLEKAPKSPINNLEFIPAGKWQFNFKISAPN
jgi:hypothetical protein